ncbi:fasciclin domain-containing protein [Chamaesiphon sp. VAR_48_metabat_135_sub]|jgi:uncharacterized surface protein with fasciclin (FAS1) repeats|uniref:fasciclin domain-containing protein n=1 Tax=Chamaesiphon sp. VAR_48_metabat_135_sub TaxID=2964699 RepID=UPI00286BBBD4|nr:fasciclin domain-containing protein [Chamaesiphon sp. VAR_48_metabat_135_sub]
MNITLSWHQCVPDLLLYMANILNTILNARELSIFATSLKVTSLDKILDDSCDFTIFAPNNLAFSQLSRVNLNFLTQDISLLTTVLSLHIIPGKLGYKDLLKKCELGQQIISIVSIDGSTIDIDLSDGIKIGKSTVLSTDASAKNGIVYAIDRVITPAS